MSSKIFYNASIKAIIVAFGTIFKDIQIITEHNEQIIVPLHYTPKEKFVSILNENMDMDSLNVETTLPRMGYEMTGISFDSSRFTNPLNRIVDYDKKDKKYMFNRVPYNLSFSLYLATKKFETSLQIVEQILPFFNPELNISIRDKEDFGLITDIPVILDGVSFSIDWEGNFDEKRKIEWEMNFTVKAWIYGDTRLQERIKKTIITVESDETNKTFNDLTGKLNNVKTKEIDSVVINAVIPDTAFINDEYTIVEKIYHPYNQVLELEYSTGEELIGNLN